MPKICQRYAQDTPKMCLRYAQDMPKICLGYPQGMSPRYTQDMLKICPRYVPDIPQDMPKIYPKYAQNMPKICPRYSQDIPKIGPRYCQISKTSPTDSTWIQESLVHLKTASTCLVVLGFHVRVRVSFWQELQVWSWGRTLPGQTKVFQLQSVQQNVLDYLVGLLRQ